MKPVVFLAFVALAAAGTEKKAFIIRQAYDTKSDGSYSQSFATADGIAVEESGFNRRYDAETAGINSRGSFSYTAPDNTPIMVEWVADENGYRATGAHLPVAPELPDHVVKMLADLRAAGVL